MLQNKSHLKQVWNTINRTHLLRQISMNEYESGNKQKIQLNIYWFYSTCVSLPFWANTENPSSVPGVYIRLEDGRWFRGGLRPAVEQVDAVDVARTHVRSCAEAGVGVGKSHHGGAVVVPGVGQSARRRPSDRRHRWKQSSLFYTDLS